MDKKDLINQYLILIDDIDKNKKRIQNMNEHLDKQYEKLRKYEKEIFKIILEDNNINK